MDLPGNILRQYFKVSAEERLTTAGMSVIIAIRGISRQAQLHQCIRWALNQTLSPVEVIVVEEDRESVIDLSPFSDKPNVRHLFLQSNKLFCKSACYNHGVSNAMYRFICGVDADILIPSEFLMAGYLYLQKCHACFIADDIYYIENSSDHLTDFKFTGQTWKTHRADWQFHGGVFFIHKQLYYDIGGHDEWFVGYGSEDSDFYKRCHDMLHVAVDSFAVLHMEHDRDPVDKKSAVTNERYALHIQETALHTRVNQLKSHNKHLTGGMLKTPHMRFPNIPPHQIGEKNKQKRKLMGNLSVHINLPEEKEKPNPNRR